MDKTLYAGPWVGEFGFLLGVFDPICRKLAEGFDRVLVEGPPAFKWLCADYAHEYIDNPTVSNTSDVFEGKAERVIDSPSSTTLLLRPNYVKHCRMEMQSFSTPNVLNVIAASKKWRCFAPAVSIWVADVICFFRPPKLFEGVLHTDKEWPIERCTELVEKLLMCGLTVACAGGPDNYHVDGAIDLCGIELEKLCGALASATVALGPSSGPLHLASLCRTPHVVWYNRADSGAGCNMYSDHWNPFQTRGIYLPAAATDGRRGNVRHGLARLERYALTFTRICYAFSCDCVRAFILFDSDKIKPIYFTRIC